MKILVDTNVLFSAILYENSRIAKGLAQVNTVHEIYLATQNITELREIVRRKLPNRRKALERFLKSLAYEVIPTTQAGDIKIRDVKDQPILNAAKKYGVEVIITGDKDFLELQSRRPRCMTMTEFLREYGE